MSGILQITNGSTNYAFDGVTEIPIRIKPLTGETVRQTGKTVRDDLLDAPWHISSFYGLGMSHADSDVLGQAIADLRCWETKNIMAWWPGMWCLGPKAQVPTDITGTHRIKGFFQFRNNYFYFADVVESVTTESVAYWVAGTTTWTDCTVVADFNATVAGSGFNCVGMAEQDGNIYALRDLFVAPAARYQLVRSTNGTTWTLIDHVNAADCPSPVITIVSEGLISIAGILYTATLDTSNRILLRQNAAGNSGVTWTTTATSKESVSAITGLIAYYDYAGVQRPYVLTPEGVFLWDGTTFYKVVNHIGLLGFNDANTGKNPNIWDVESIEGGYLVYPLGKNVVLFHWGANNTPIRDIISPTYKTQGLPAFRDGLVTAITSTPDFLFVSIGGDSASTTGGIYARPAQYIHPLGWFGPFYDIATANRQIRAMHVSSYSDGVVRLHVGVDNGTANDTNPLFFANITKDPRTVSSYAHAPTGTNILPKNDRDLSEQNGVWLKWEFIGTNISSTNKITDVFVSADAAPLASDGSWGTTLGEATSSGATVNFAATPTGTGQSAKAVQGRVDLEGGSDASPYIETMNIYVDKQITVKLIHTFAIPLPDQGSVMARAVRLAHIKSIVTATTYSSVTYGEISATVMKPYIQGGRALTYTDSLDRPGTVNAHSNSKFVLTEFVEV